MKNQIKYPATCTVHWVTGPVDACEEHARQLVALGRVFGFSHVAVTVLDHEATCSNCENEAPKENKKD